MAARWRAATAADDDAIVAMCLALFAEDPSDEPIDAARVRRTLARLRAEPVRGRAVVAERDGAPIGYAFLASFWSNEYGGELCVVDELYVVAAHRGGGIGTSLFDAVASDRALWPERPVALELEVTPDNARARALYQRLGFKAKNALLRRPIA
jgi:GNAT superfamily N-acetyltransferase